MKDHLLLGIRLHGRWSRQASGRLIKVKYTGNSFGGSESGLYSKWSFKRSGCYHKFDCIFIREGGFMVTALHMICTVKAHVQFKEGYLTSQVGLCIVHHLLPAFHHCQSSSVIHMKMRNISWSVQSSKIESKSLEPKEII